MASPELYNNSFSLSLAGGLPSGSVSNMSRNALLPAAESWARQDTPRAAGAFLRLKKIRVILSMHTSSPYCREGQNRRTCRCRNVDAS